MSFVHPVFAVAATLVALLACMVLGRFRAGEASGRYRTIDGLRGYLAFFVFLHHTAITYFFVVTGTWRAPPSNLFTHLGEASVAFFFMITAFLFYGKVLDSHGGPIDWPKLFVSRILRLAPLYVLVVILILAVVWVESDGRLVDPVGYTLRNIVRWLSFTVLGAPSLNGVFAPRIIAEVNWSLPYEWYFYLSIPLLAVATRIRVGWPYLLLGVAALAFALSTGSSLYFFSIFVGGIVAAFGVRLQSVTRFAQTRLADILVLACMGFLVVLFPSAYGYPQLLLLTIAFTLIAGGSDVFGLLTAKPSHVLGELSYSIYLLHGMLLYVIAKHVIGYETIRSVSTLAYWGGIFVLTPVLLIIATMTFRVVEFPAMQMTPRVMKRLRSSRMSRPSVLLDDGLGSDAGRDTTESAR